MDNLFGLPKLAIPLSYYAYRRGDYTPSEVQPIICIRGKRKWYAPWSRHPDQCHPGMSQAMAFRMQDAWLPPIRE